MDLTKTTPRSVRETVLGGVQLARTTDKVKAQADGTIGEYHYDSPMDQGVLEFLEIKSSDYLNFVKHAKSDAEIETFLKDYVAKKSPDEIRSFNKRWMTTKPTGESLEHFNKMRSEIAPGRTDVTTWPDLLDLEEGRPVGERTTVSV